MRHANNEKWQTTLDGRSRTTKSKTHRKRETCRYLGILEADTIKQQEMKVKLKKSISEKPENYLRQNSKAGNLTKA